jgi:hypothetical protein
LEAIPMKTHQALSSSVAAAIATFALATFTATAQVGTPPEGQLKSTEMQSVRAAVMSPKPAKMDAVIMQFTGTFDDLPAKFEAFTKEFESQGLRKRPLKTRPTGIFVVYENPQGKSSFKLGVGVQVETKIDVKDPLKVETFDLPRAVHVPHTGSYRNLQKIHDAIESESKNPKAPESIRGRSSTYPVVARLLNDPRKIPDSQRRTELLVPF